MTAAKRIAIAALMLTWPTAAGAFDAEQLWRAWPEERFATTVAPCLRHEELTASLRDLARRHAGNVELEVVGHSVAGREIHLLTLGRGDTRILLWSQMHGDEPSATPALLDIADYLLRNEAEPAVRGILDRFTLLMVPMLNPDGAEIYRRRNLQGIDINRDALNLATPEGRLLKSLREEHEPMLGFNLHDQNRRTAVGGTGKLATNAVLAVAGDPENTLTPGRERAKRACAAIIEALAPFVPGGMARYDEDWSPRAFGDNLTAWGTPVVLIESGGLPPGRPWTDLTRTNFVAILMALDGLADDDLAGFDPAVYEALPRNQNNSWTDVAIRGGQVVQPAHPEPYRADLSFNVERDDRALAGCASGGEPRSWIAEIGDSRFIAAGREIDAEGALVVPPFVAGVEGWGSRRWLDAEALARLARLGVGEIRWVVSAKRVEDARRLAGELDRPRGLNIYVAPSSAPLPWLVLDGPPGEARDEAVSSIGTALAGERWTRAVASGSTTAALQLLWNAAGDAPALAPGRPASFLLFVPVEQGGSLDRAELRAVYLDGSEVTGE